jgi:glycine betaine/proline transport system substrate-binding protein
VYGAVTRVNIGLGFEAGLSVVIIAMFLDRMTTALSSHSAVEKAKRLATREPHLLHTSPAQPLRHARSMTRRRTMRTKRLALTGAVALAAAGTLAACGGGDDDTITIGVHAGWEEGIAISYLWANVLEEQGYTVELETADAGVVFQSLADGTYDLNFDTWLPATHADYLERYGDDIEEVGMWYENAPLTIAVNEDAPIQSLDELADNADEFGNRLVGIDPGAGLTRITEDEVIPTYGLEDMEFVVSSTSAMLAELGAAMDSGENIVVPLWRPHWAYDAFDIRDLEDPEGALGEPDDIYIYGHSGFAEENEEVAGWLSNFTMGDEDLASLENIIFNEGGGDDPAAGVEQWLEENPDFADSMISE